MACTCKCLRRFDKANPVCVTMGKGALTSCLNKARLGTNKNKTKAVKPNSNSTLNNHVWLYKRSKSNNPKNSNSRLFTENCLNADWLLCKICSADVDFNCHKAGKVKAAKLIKAVNRPSTKGLIDNTGKARDK